MNLPTPPYAVEESVLRWDCSMKDLVTFKVERHEDGSIDYAGVIPEDYDPLVVLAIETNDGIFVLVLEKK
jgi:hypothetical protein